MLFITAWFLSIECGKVNNKDVARCINYSATASLMEYHQLHYCSTMYTESVLECLPCYWLAMDVCCAYTCFWEYTCEGLHAADSSCNSVWKHWKGCRGGMLICSHPSLWKIPNASPAKNIHKCLSWRVYLPVYHSMDATIRDTINFHTHLCYNQLQQHSTTSNHVLLFKTAEKNDAGNKLFCIYNTHDRTCKSQFSAQKEAGNHSYVSKLMAHFGPQEIVKCRLCGYVMPMTDLMT